MRLAVPDFSFEGDAIRIVRQDPLRALNRVVARVGTRTRHVVREKNHPAELRADKRRVHVRHRNLLAEEATGLLRLRPQRHPRLTVLHRHEMVELIAAVDAQVLTNRPKAMRRILVALVLRIPI